MTAQQAIDLIKWIPNDKVLIKDVFKLSSIRRSCLEGHKPDRLEAEFVTYVYRYTSDGDVIQDQEFKQYKRKKSWGV